MVLSQNSFLSGKIDFPYFLKHLKFKCILNSLCDLPRQISSHHAAAGRAKVFGYELCHQLEGRSTVFLAGLHC